MLTAAVDGGSNSRAAERLERHRREMVDAASKRSITTAAGAGAELVPPEWLTNLIIPAARSGRAVADAAVNLPLPASGISVNMGKVSTGVSVANIADLGAVAQVDLTTASVSAGVVYAAGQEEAAVQLADRTPSPGLDAAIYADLTAATYTVLETQVVTGSGVGTNVLGIFNVSVPASNAVTFTSASPGVLGAGQLYSKAANLYANLCANRLALPQCWIMHPRRYAWIADLVANSASTTGTAAGVLNDVDSLPPSLARVAPEAVPATMLGLPILLSFGVPTNNGAGTNEDVLFLVRASDLFLFEGQMAFRVLRDTAASSNLAVRFQSSMPYAFAANRITSAIGRLTGTGMVTPAF
jgi:HK97 family phage major capsid protein